MVIQSAIKMFPEPSWARLVWFYGVKKCLGFGLRFNLVPARHREILGSIHRCITSAVLGRRKFGFARTMMIEMSSICNAKCGFCPYPILEFPRKIMTNDFFTRSVDFAIRLGIRDFDLTPYLGEAFVDPQFMKRVRQLHDRVPNGKIRFTTNGTFFQRCDCEELLTSGVGRINISFGAWGREDYLKLYNIDAWETVLSGVRKLLDAKKALQSKVKIALWYRTLDAQKVRANPENRKFLECYRDVIDEIIYTDVYHDILTISGQQPKHLRLAPRVDASRIKRPPCANLGTLAVNSTGNIFMCYCGATDCYKQEKSWFYLGSMHKPFDLNKSLAAKVGAWERGELPESCKTCPVYVPANKPDSIEYSEILSSRNDSEEEPLPSLIHANG